MDAASLCRSMGGVASRAELVSRGATRGALDAALATGDLRRIARGIYAVPEAPFAQRAARVWDGRLTCVTALRALGLPAPSTTSTVHLAIGAQRSLPPSRRHPVGTCLHWLQDPSWAATTLGSLDVSSLCLSDINQLAAIDAGLQRGLITRADLDELRVTPPSRAAWLRAQCDPTCQSPYETIARVAMREAGLSVATQVQLTGRHRVDFVVDGSVVVEIDGQPYHMNERAFWVDRRRDREATLRGHTPLRFTGEDVKRDLGGLVDTVSAVVQVNRARDGKPPLRLRREPLPQPWRRTWQWRRSTKSRTN